MAISLKVKMRGLSTCLLFLGASLGHPQAADRLGMPILDVSTLDMRARELVGKEIAVSGDVLFPDHGPIRITGRFDHGPSVNLDTRKMRPTDRQRLSLKCSLSPCSEIVTGYVVGGRFEAVASYAFQGGSQL